MVQVFVRGLDVVDRRRIERFRRGVIGNTGVTFRQLMGRGGGRSNRLIFSHGKCVFHMGTTSLRGKVFWLLC